MTTGSAPVPRGQRAAIRELEKRLRAALPAGCFGAEPAKFEIDGQAPALVVSPASTQGVALAMREASSCGAAVVPWGGGSHMALGMPPGRYGLALDLHRLSEVVEYEPADLTVTVQAGLRLADLQDWLAAQGQWLALDPPCASSSTIGGVLATNAAGPARIAHGTARDLVIGMMVATAGGQLVKSGGRVVKNVAGYDLAKMHIGALGTLGVIVQTTLKVAPLPKAVRAISIDDDSDSIEALLRLAFRVRDAGLPATGLAVTRLVGAPARRLVLRFAGSPAAVDRSTETASRLAQDERLVAEQVPEKIWQELGAVRSSDPGVLVRISHLPSDALRVFGQAAELRADVLVYPTTGLTYARLLTLARAQQDSLRALRGDVEAAGGALVLEAAQAEAKRELGVWGAPRGDFALMQALKREMDPEGTLNPGRFVAGI